MRFSFRVTLFTLMLAVLLTAVLLMGTAAFLYARYAAENLGGQVLVQVEKRVEQQMRHSLDLAEDEAETVERLIAKGWLESGNPERLAEYFLAALRARPGLSYLSFGMPDGTYCHAFRNDDGHLSVLWLVPGENGKRRLQEFSVMPDGQRTLVNDIENSTRTPPYERPYYRAALAAGKAIWTESYVFLGSGESLDVPGVSRAVPVYSREGGGLLGVLTADFDLHSLSGFLTEVDLGEGGLCFLMEIGSDGEPRVIAHPDAVSPDAERRMDLTSAPPNGEGRVLKHAKQLKDARVGTFLASFGIDLADIQPRLHKVKVRVGDRSYVGGFRHLGRTDGPDWIICMLLSDDEVFGGVHRMARIMAVLGLGGIVIAALLSMVLSRRVSATLGRIAGETREIGNFRLEAKPPMSSRIREISTLATAVEEMKTGLRSFQKYVPSELVRTLIESGQEAELGGTRKELTVFFSDIVGFTSISEQLSPEQLVDVLSTYLEEMTGEVMRHGGTVDKFIGDAIMAFWGAPRDHETPAVSACRAALANQQRLAELRAGWVDAKLPALRARIGLHTGEATVGNFGSRRRLDYTAIGDTVNVASRLEGLNRLYGTEIMISEMTRVEVAGCMVTRPLDRVAVKGREQGILVHELVGELGKVTDEVMRWRDGYADALSCYFARDWERAIDGFQRALDLKNDDAAAMLMIERCRVLAADLTGEGWDGVFQAPK